jgi:L-histidine Nalpha-methyltransferase
MKAPSSDAKASSRIEFLVRATEDPLKLDGPNVIRNLTSTPKKIAAVYVYDKRGTDLFEQQCDTPEYYLRRAEAELLRAHAREIVTRTAATRVVELGAGTADKTRILLAEYDHRGLRCDYFPIDVDVDTLARAALGLVAEFPRVWVHCLGTTYENGLRTLPVGASASASANANAAAGPSLILFLGSSIGNMELHEIDALLAAVWTGCAPGDYLLVGADLDKDPGVIDRAYNDAAGYGPRSTLNMLSHLNHRYGGNFVVDNFRYQSRYDPQIRRNEVRLESLVAQTVTLATLDLTVQFDAGELIDAEIMWKFDVDQLGAILGRAGFTMVDRWIEPIYRYGLFLAQRQ